LADTLNAKCGGSLENLSSGFAITGKTIFSFLPAFSISSSAMLVCAVVPAHCTVLCDFFSQICLTYSLCVKNPNIIEIQEIAPGSQKYPLLFYKLSK
jgi:hypothetical protein